MTRRAPLHQDATDPPRESGRQGGDRIAFCADLPTSNSWGVTGPDWGNGPRPRTGGRAFGLSVENLCNPTVFNNISPRSVNNGNSNHLELSPVISVYEVTTSNTDTLDQKH